MKVGDTVQLKQPQQGRKYLGKIIKIHNGLIRVGLPNGLYVELPKSLWELAEERKTNSNVEEN